MALNSCVVHMLTGWSRLTFPSWTLTECPPSPFAGLCYNAEGNLYDSLESADLQGPEVVSIISSLVRHFRLNQLQANTE